MTGEEIVVLAAKFSPGVNVCWSSRCQFLTNFATLAPFQQNDATPIIHHRLQNVKQAFQDMLSLLTSHFPAPNQTFI